VPCHIEIEFLVLTSMQYPFAFDYIGKRIPPGTIFNAHTFLFKDFCFSFPVLRFVELVILVLLS
jgi:hypothetical protein